MSHAKWGTRTTAKERCLAFTFGIGICPRIKQRADSVHVLRLDGDLKQRWVVLGFALFDA